MLDISSKNNNMVQIEDLREKLHDSRLSFIVISAVFKKDANQIDIIDRRTNTIFLELTFLFFIVYFFNKIGQHQGKVMNQKFHKCYLKLYNS